MSDTIETQELTDYRVLFQYVDGNGPIPDSNRPAVERYEFTTVLARSPEEAAAALQSSGYHDQDDTFQIVQVVESNGVATGFPDREVEAESDTPVYDALAEGDA